MSERSLERFELVARREAEVTILEAAILRYLGMLRKVLLTEHESRQAQALMESLVTFELLAGVTARELSDIVRQRSTRESSAETRAMLQGLYETVQKAMSLTVHPVAMPTPTPPARWRACRRPWPTSRRPCSSASRDGSSRTIRTAWSWPGCRCRSSTSSRASSS